MMFRPEPLDLVLILVVALILFGPKRLPELSRSMGKAIREFREAVTHPEEGEAAPRAEPPDREL